MLRTIAAATLLLPLLCAGCTTDDPEWTVARAEPFSLSAAYPASLFPKGFLSRAQHDAEWIFGPYPDGTSLLLQARRDDSNQSPYHAACASTCPHETYRLDLPALGISSGQIGQKTFYSQCVRQGREMHCLHVIYPSAEKSLYGPVVQRMSAAFH
jgi:hypothetical protein